MTDIASHRGGAALWPENSELAFRETLKLGVEQIEFDVQLSADGVPVIFHDATLDRVTDGAGPLGERTLSELKRFTIFNGGGKIMTLREGVAILASSRIVLRCEIKPGVDLVPYTGLVEKTLAELRAAGVMARTVITSFHLPTLRTVLAQSAGLFDVIWLVADPIVQLTSVDHIATMAQAENIDAVALRHTRLAGTRLARLLDAGMRVGAFGVLEDEAIRTCFDQRLTVFTTDRPGAALRIRSEYELSQARAT